MQNNKNKLCIIQTGNISPWLYSLVTSWWWDKALGPIGPGFDSHKGGFPMFIGFTPELV
ncbi:hypothetical protein HanIR_Chr01g0034841 [Helianthus annuus]|nr:hypothetical protein HanIR_Chr01g0034841 [Helianthus annuus]